MGRFPNSCMDSWILKIRIIFEATYLIKVKSPDQELIPVYAPGYEPPTTSIKYKLNYCLGLLIGLLVGPSVTLVSQLVSERGVTYRDD